MATVARDVESDSTAVASFTVVTWKDLKRGDVGDRYMNVGEGRSVQVAGTFGNKGALRITGSNDGVNFVPIRMRNFVEFKEPSIDGIGEETRFIRPEVTAGDGTTNLTVTFYTRRVK